MSERPVNLVGYEPTLGQAEVAQASAELRAAANLTRHRPFYELPVEERAHMLHTIHSNGAAIGHLVGGDPEEVVNDLLSSCIGLYRSAEATEPTNAAAQLTSAFILGNLPRLLRPLEQRDTEEARSAMHLIELMGVYADPSTRQSMQNFVARHAATIMSSGCLITSVGRDIILHADPDTRSVFCTLLQGMLEHPEAYQPLMANHNTAYGFFDIPCDQKVEPAHARLLARTLAALLRPKLAAYWLDSSDIVAAHWAGGGDRYLGHTMKETVETIERLERLRPGICATLRYSIFRLRMFGRYEDDMLLDQYDNMESDAPYSAVWIAYQSANPDETDVFARNTLNSITRYRKPLRQSPYYATRFFEMRLQDLQQTQKWMDEAYGRAYKIGGLVICAHGNQQGVWFGEEELWPEGADGGSAQQRPAGGTPVTPESQGDTAGCLLLEDAPGALKPEFFEPGANVLLYSCDGGLPNGSAQKLSESGLTVSSLMGSMYSGCPVRFRKGPDGRSMHGQIMHQPASDKRTYTSGRRVR